MLVCMRTTINLPDGLGAAAKARAARDGRTFTSLVEEGLRVVLDREPSTTESTEAALPAFGDPDAQLLVDLADREALWRALDADGPR